MKVPIVRAILPVTLAVFIATPFQAFAAPGKSKPLSSTSLAHGKSHSSVSTSTSASSKSSKESSPPSSSASATIDNTKSSPITSFLSYVPQKEEFDTALRTIVGKLSALNPQKKDSNATALRSILGQLDQAETSFTRGLHHQIYFLRGYAFELLGDEDNALAAYQQTIRLRMDNPVAIFRAAWLLKSAHQCPKAMSMFDEAKWRIPALSYETDYAKALCMTELGDTQGADALVLKIHQQAPFFAPVAALFVAQQAKKLQDIVNPADRHAAEAQLLAAQEVTYKSNPNDTALALDYGRVLYEFGDPLLSPERLQTAEQVVSKVCNTTKYRDEQAIKLLVDINLKQQDRNGALATLKKGLAHFPKSDLLLESKRQLDLDKSIRGL